MMRGGAFDCYDCNGKGWRGEPHLMQGSLRRWIKIAHLLVEHPGSSAVELVGYLNGAYGKGSVAGILGAMREYGLVEKIERGTPTRWLLTKESLPWQALWCPECLRRTPDHKKTCNRPPALISKQEISSAVVSELLGDIASSEIQLRRQGDRMEVTLNGQKLTLNATQGKELAAALDGWLRP